MDTRPFASIIIPVYNGEATLRDCLHSILHQTYPADGYEVIVVDNNSTDRTKAIVNEFPVRYVLENKIQGPSVARNTGAQLAQGPALVFFDADQIAKNDYLQKLLQGWEDRQYGAFAALNVGIKSRDDITGDYWAEEWRLKINEGYCPPRPQFSGGLIAIRKDVFEKLSGFDIHLPTCEDTDLAWRLQKELGLRIKYNHDAVARHQGRSTLKALLRREFFLGAGSYLLGKKHNEAKRPILLSLFKAVKRTALGLGACLLGLLKYCWGRYTLRNLKVTVLDMAMTWMNVAGKMHGLIMNLQKARRF